MSKAFVIKGVNFLANKLDTIVFSEDVPCTGIALNKNSTSLTAIGATETLTATLTPANTTDSVSWVSSNTDAVTVNNGLLTAVGVGSATITVTCGNQSATCAVGVTNILEWMYWLHRQNSKHPQSDRVFNQASSNGKYAAIQSATVADHNIWVYDYQAGGTKYPIIIGAGADTVTINVPSYVKPTVWFTDSKSPFDGGTGNQALVISGDSSPYDKNVPYGNRVVTVPEGADSMVLSLYISDADITDADVAQVTIVASKSAS